MTRNMAVLEHSDNQSVAILAVSQPLGLTNDGFEYTICQRATVYGVRLFNSGALHESHGYFEDK